jgi:two-component system, LytTR family, sensor kinase
MELPKYTSKDYQVMLWIMLPFSIVLNSFIFGRLYFSGWGIFFFASLLTSVASSIDFIICGYVAVALKARFPTEKQMAKRLTLMILMFLIITGLFLFFLFTGYETIGFYGYTFNENGFIWAYICMGIVNIFLTFLHEGIARYEEWKANLKETEQVRLSYKHSQLLGLKSQINPHFLFNSLNTLSSLISEDEETAEKFLDEMSKIYRYLLRNDDDQLVTLQTELSFIESYFYLLNTRYSNALNLEINVEEEDRTKYLPPLTLQVIVENAIVQNAFSKTSPLRLSIGTSNDELIVSNSLQRKKGIDQMDVESGLDNLIEKYRLIHGAPVRINENASERVIHVPLIYKKEKMAL